MTTCPHQNHPCPRCTRILTLLEHLDDYLPTLGSNIASNGGVMQMPPMWHHPSVKELHRTIDRLYDADHTAHAHMLAYYKSEWRTVTTKRRIKTRKGFRTEDGPLQRQRIISRWIINSAKQRGETWILNHYRGEPFLPNELLEELASA